MKKIIKILIVLIMMFSFNIKVFAEDEKKDTSDGKEETKEVSKEEKKEEEKEEVKETEKEVDLTLKNVKINEKNIVCNENREYIDIITDNSVDTVKVTYELSDKNAEVNPEGGFTKSIQEGENKFEVKVSSKEKSVTYTFVITKKSQSTDSTLKKLSINNEEIELKEGISKYQTTVGYSIKKLEIEAVANDDKASVIDFKSNKASFDFFENSKEIMIKVEAEDGEITTYNLTVTRRSKTDVTLKSLTVKNYKLDFSSDVTDYELKVLKNVDKLDIEAKASDSKSQVKITNPTLQLGENEVKVEVSNDGNINTYFIKVIKLDEDDKTLANLKSLKIDDYELNFDADRYEYNLKINSDVNFLVINAKSKVEDAEVEITGNLDLVDGSIIKIKVSYDEDVYNVYKIHIIKDGTVVSKTKTSKKAIVAVILFDIFSAIAMFILQITGNNKKKSNDKLEMPSNSKKKVSKTEIDEEKKSRVKKEKNILDNLDDEIIDII